MVEFVDGRPDLVRAINQRWLLKLWNRTRGDRALPAWQDLDTKELEGNTVNLSYFEVVRNGVGPRFLIHFHGTQMAEVYGSQCAGKFLDETLPAAMRTPALAVYKYLLEVRRPIYTISDIRDGERRLVQFERLLLPFAANGVDVDRIVTSHELVSAEGAFQMRNLMRSQTEPPTYTCCATIRH